MTFAWNDPFLLEEQLSDDERMIRDAAAAFAKAELMPRVGDAYLEEKTDAGLFRLMGQAGLLGVTLPDTYGAAGANYVSYGLVAREVERIDSGYRSMMSVQSSLVIYPIHAYGSDAQKTTYLPGLVSGELIGCFGLTESDAGSDPGGTVPRRMGNAYPNIVPYQVFPASDGHLIVGLEAAGVPGGPIHTVAEALEDPQIAARGLRIDPEGLPGLRTPIGLSRSPLTLEKAAPVLGGGQWRFGDA